MKLGSRLPERANRPRSRLVTLLAAGALTLGIGGFGIAMTAGPAMADPTCQEVAVGSDTIQDVMNQYSVDLAGNLLCSFNATDPVSGATGNNISYIRGLNATQPATTCTYTRPNGSSQGVVALRESIYPSTTASPPLTTPAPAGCVDIAMSSSGPTSNTGGALTFIPFAEDAVTGAVGPATGGTVQGVNGPVTTVATSITQGNLFTEANLVTLYTDCDTVTVGSGSSQVTYWPLGSSEAEPTGAQQIDLYVPQAGSGTLKFWATELGFSATSLPGCVFDTIQNGSMKGDSVEEHDGATVGTDPDGYMPFSIAQWISQSKHTTGDPVDIDRRYGAVLQDINSISPFTSSGSLNTAFPFNREVYNVVEGCRVDSTAPLPFTGATCSMDSNLVSMLVGTGSSLCQDELTIINYGFALLVNNSVEPDTCGSIAASLRSQPPPV